jgi:hypothetical protein
MCYTFILKQPGTHKMNSLKVYPGIMRGSMEYYQKQYHLIEATTCLEEGYTTLVCGVDSCSYRLKVRNAKDQPGKFVSITALYSAEQPKNADLLLSFSFPHLKVTPSPTSMHMTLI